MHKVFFWPLIFCVFFAPLVIWAQPAPEPPAAALKAPDPATKPLVLLPIPLEGKSQLTPATADYIQQETAAVLKGNPASPVVSVTFLEPMEPVEPSLEALVNLKGKKATDLLEPFVAKASADGALAYWLEGDVTTAPKIVGLFYLPKQLKLEQFQVSLNLEREPVAINGGKFAVDGISNAFRAVVERNLSRIIPTPPTPKSSGNMVPDLGGTQDPPAGGHDMVPPSANGRQSAPVSGKGGLTDEEMETQTPFTHPASLRSSRSPPEAVGVLPFSRQFRSKEKDLQDQFGKVVLDAENWQSWALAAVPQGIPRKELSGPTLTFEQLEGSAVTIDPDYDPKTKLRRLAKLATSVGVDALLIGHLREVKGAGSSSLVASLRLFVTNPNDMVTEQTSWMSEVKKRDIKKALGTMVDANWRKIAPVKKQSQTKKKASKKQPQKQAKRQPRKETLQYRIKDGDTLFDLANRCFPGVLKAVRELAAYNKIKNPHHIRMGQVLMIPAQLKGHARDPRCGAAP